MPPTPPTETATYESAIWRRFAILFLALGAALRIGLILIPRTIDDDSGVYAELGRNLFHRGTFGMVVEGDLSPSIFRLPGYPIFLALLGGHYPLALAVQTVTDLLACLLLGLMVRRWCGLRAGLLTLALAATCPFTASYAAQALTESLSVFAVAAGMYFLSEALATQIFTARKLLPIALSASLAMLLRPDGAILTAALALGLIYDAARQLSITQAIRATAVFCLLAIIPLVPWTIRNERTFHVFQPLAPRHVNDPGERINLGFYRWLRTWAVDFETTADVFWKVGTERIELRFIPARACSTPADCAETQRLLAAYNVRKDLDQPLDDQFNLFAGHLIAEHPIRYYVLIPIARIADMFLRPRTDGTNLDADWWRFNHHYAESYQALALALLNFAYIALATAGAIRYRSPILLMMVAYLAMRCLLLGTIENSEPRYTLETYPILLACAGTFFRCKP